MAQLSNFWPLMRAAGLSLFLALAAVAQPLVGSVPTGLRPLGIAITTAGGSPGAGQLLSTPEYAVVANSGENSVTILGLTVNSQRIVTVSSSRKVEGIPAPYAVVACFGVALVSSPDDNSVSVLDAPSGAILGKFHVGPRPRSLACFQGGGVVSNQGDNTLVAFSLNPLKVTAVISGVPASEGLHGIAVFPDRTGDVAWVPSESANVVSLVDLSGFRVLVQIPVARPTTILTDVVGNKFVASAGDNAVLFVDDTLHVGGGWQNVPNPQDAVLPDAGAPFAVIGGQDAVFKFGEVVRGIPAPAAVARRSFGSYSLPCTIKPGCVNYARVLAYLVTSTGSNSVFIFTTEFLTPHDFGMANGASFRGVGAPGSLASIFLATAVNQSFRASSLPLPTTLGGVTVNFGGTLIQNTSGVTYSSTGAVAAPLLFVGPDQINFQIPEGLTTTTPLVQLTQANGDTRLTQVALSATSAPGIFTLLQNGQGQGAVLNTDFSQNGSPQFIVGAKPAAPGSVIQIFATGAGATNPPVAAGTAAPGSPLALTVAQPTVTIGGKTAQVQFSGLAPGFVGLWQINAVVPADATPGSAVPLLISAGGVTSNTVTIAVQ